MNRIRVYNNVEDLPPPYRILFSEVRETSGIFFSLPWFRNLITTTFEKNTTLRIYACDNNPYWLLLMCQHEEKRRFFKPRILAPVANYYSPIFSPTFGKIMPLQEDLNKLASYIANEIPVWDIVDLHPLDRESPLFERSKSALRKAGMAVQTYFYCANWYLNVNGRSYGEYFLNLPPQLRNTLKRKTKSLDEKNRIRIEIIQSMTNLATHIATFEAIYNASWKKSEPHPDFIPGLILICAEHGWLRLGIAYIDNHPAAAQIWIVNNSVASIYKLAYDDKFSNLSIGSILTARLMQHVIDVDHVSEVDFLTGDENYKRDWMSDRRERWGIIAFNLRSFKGLIAATKNFGGHAIKRIIKYNQ